MVAIKYKEYKPDDKTANIEMKTRLNEIKIQRDEDPIIMFNQISTIQNHYDDYERNRKN